MRHEQIQIGATYTCKIGCNTIRVTITSEADGGGWLAQTQTGRTMTIRNADRFLEQVSEPATPEAAALAAGKPKPETGPGAATTAVEEAEPTPTSESAPKRATGEQNAPTRPTDGSLSLLDAAVQLLGQAAEPMRCQDLVDQARESGLWAPKRGGKTPDRTLYAAILREINTKGDTSRFRKAERGRFALNA